MRHWAGDPGLAAYYGLTPETTIIAPQTEHNFIWGDHGYGQSSFVTDLATRPGEVDYYYEDGNGAIFLANEVD